MIAGTDLFLGLFNNLAIFIVLTAVYGILNAYLETASPMKRQSAMGICFGLFAVACMYVKIPVADGVIVDQRNAVTALSGAFGGPVAVAICAVITGSYRIFLGGAGVTAGVTGVLLAATAGIGLHFLRKRSNNPYLFALGAAASVVVILPGFLLVGDFHTGLNLAASMALPYGSAIFLGIFLVGGLMSHEEGRQAAQRALQSSEKQFRDMFSRLVDVSYRTDAQGRIVYMSPSTKRMFGFAPEELKGVPIGTFYRHPELREAFVKSLIQNKTVENFEAEIRNKDGSFTWVSTNAVMITDENGTFMGVEGVTRDISRLKKAEAEKLRLEDSLRQRQKMEALGTLAGGIAHDFNNILGAVIGFTELVLENTPPGSRDRHYMESVLGAAERAAQLTKQILMFSRKRQPDKKAVAVHRVVEEALNLLQKTIPAGVRLVTDVDASTGTISADPTQIHQIVVNLCTNAYHALSEETGTITVALKAEIVDAGAAKNIPGLKAGRFAVLTVKDNGKGIGEEDLPRIFEPFFTTKDKGRGTGLGLSVVHGIVSDHGGAVEVKSTSEIGSVFRVYLPLSDEKEAPQPTAEEPLPGGSERILLVDDEPALVDVSRAVLEGLGYRVFATCSALEALAVFRKTPDAFDLLISDQTMPEMSGDALATEVLRLRPEFKVIICTGHSAVFDAEKAEALGICAFLMKPVTRTLTAQTVRKVLDTPDGKDQS